MFSKVIPWKMFLQRAAHHYGFIDPIHFLARMQKFSQPSEVQEPMELLRAGVIFHARGLLNTRAIQTNLDWVWPYWVVRQFNPGDPSFMPRAFSFSHVNLTHRNWTAVGHPQLPLYPIVDPRGLVTPLFDGWSLDFWLLERGGAKLLPSQLENVDQELIFNPNLKVVTAAEKERMFLRSAVSLSLGINMRPRVVIDIEAHLPRGGTLAVALRPYNPEGIQFIETLKYDAARNAFNVDNTTSVLFDKKPESIHFSNYEHGDVIHHLSERDDQTKGIHCSVGMVTAAALYNLPKGDRQETLKVSIPLQQELKQEIARIPRISTDWHAAIETTAKLELPDEHFQFLYRASVHTLLLLSANQVVPGPYTYFRFWFRDACLMLNALLALGARGKVRESLREFARQQKRSGYFQSQEGEWDSNGQVLWVFDRFEQVTGERLDDKTLRSVKKAAAWIMRKRVPDNQSTLHAGLMPSGFSAEHFGPNDYYYWDDFWSVAGLYAAARLYGRRGNRTLARHLQMQAEKFESAVMRSLSRLPPRRTRGGIPASPYRRMDSGAIGSLVADYPLQLFPCGDSRIRVTTDFLVANCFHDGAFFQDMIHSGINIYLTLDIAQTLLRSEDDRYRALLRRVADLASPTGQWPEAVHPLTGGGCMGDGQHGWAAAEWVMMIRNLFLREEGDQLIVGSGLFPEWFNTEQRMAFGPTLTPFGAVNVSIEGRPGNKTLSVRGEWFSQPAKMLVSIPGYRRFELERPVLNHPLQASEETLP